MSMSHFMMELNVVSWLPQDSITQEGRLNKSLRAAELLIDNSDDLDAYSSCLQIGRASCRERVSS